MRERVPFTPSPEVLEETSPVLSFLQLLEVLDVDTQGSPEKIQNVRSQAGFIAGKIAHATKDQLRGVLRLTQFVEQEGLAGVLCAFEDASRFEPSARYIVRGIKRSKVRK